MRQLVISSPGVVELREAETPRPGPGEVRVLTKAVGTCGPACTHWRVRTALARSIWAVARRFFLVELTDPGRSGRGRRFCHG